MPNLQYLDISEVVINDNRIPDDAFSRKNNLKSITLPNGLTAIGYAAFYECTALALINFPSSLQTVEGYAFQSCISLTQTIFQEGLQTIGYYAFRDCAALQTLAFPFSLQTIEENAFQNCTSLTQAAFQEGLQTIGNQAFYNCSKLSGQLILPSTLTGIGYEAFYECNKLTSCKISAETPPSLYNEYSLGNIYVVYVPEIAKNAYKAASYWQSKIIVGGDQPTALSLNITTPGTLGEKALEQFEHLSDINILTLSGTLNSTDFNQIKTGMGSLLSVDISGITNTELPNDLFNGRRGLMNINLPANLKKIGSYCFYSCTALPAPEFPASLEEIGNSAFDMCYNIYSINLPNALSVLGSYAFASCINMNSVVFPASSLKTINSNAFAYCYALTEINIPESVTAIGSYAFYNCSSLRQVSLPSNLTTIESYTFRNCYSLQSIQLPSKLTAIGYYAFYNCSQLTQIAFPATLTSIDYYAFYNCTGLQQILCLAATPPSADSYAFYNVNKSACELIVPMWAQTTYKLAVTWQDFYNISPYNEEIKDIVVNGALSMPSNVRPLGLPNVEITPYGSLSVNGNMPFAIDQLVLKPQLRYVSYDRDGSYYSRLISECNAMTAQQVKIDMSTYGNCWYYLSFPFDVAMSDVGIDADAYYVFRYYDGESRATVGAGSSWKNVGAGDTLRTGKGYIFQCSKDISHLILPATATSKNRLFASTAQSVALEAYPSENAANRNWNLAGNPFACYYDIRLLDYTAPLTYWNDYYWRYEAVSPIDDAFLLKPYQAFFVQKPNDLSAITFPTAGRQNTTELVERVSALRSSGSRTLINLEINGQESGDKTRIVLNPAAGLNYEIEHDAAKFMSTSPETPQLYSIDASEVSYAINERPIDDGVVTLGVYTGKADSYAIALQSPVEGFEIQLVDKDLNRIVDLSDEEYTFSAEAGTFNSRFELRISKINEDNPTSVAGVKNSETNVYASKGAIVVENAIGTVSVYTVNGSQVTDVLSAGAKTVIAVPQGVYVVKTDGKVFKTVVF
jgi:hypothetical protein